MFLGRKRLAGQRSIPTIVIDCGNQKPVGAGPVIHLATITLPASGVAKPGSLPSAKLHENIEWAEKESIRRALETTQGVKKAAADALGISQRALSYYLKKFDIE